MEKDLKVKTQDSKLQKQTNKKTQNCNCLVMMTK